MHSSRSIQHRKRFNRLTSSQSNKKRFLHSIPKSPSTPYHNKLLKPILTLAHLPLSLSLSAINHSQTKILHQSKCFIHHDLKAHTSTSSGRNAPEDLQAFVDLSIPIKGNRVNDDDHSQQAQHPQQPFHTSQQYPQESSIPDKYKQFIPDLDDKALDVVRVTSRDDFNLDFELEQEWQRVNSKPQLKEGSFLSKHQESEFQAIFEKMVQAKRKEFEQERLHLVALRNKKQERKLEKIQLIQHLIESQPKTDAEIQLEEKSMSFLLNERNHMNPIESLKFETQLREDRERLELEKLANIAHMAQMHGLNKDDIYNYQMQSQQISNQEINPLAHSDKLDQRMQEHGNIDEIDILDAYFGYDDILQELFQDDRVTSASNSILHKLEYAEDPHFEVKATQMVSDMVLESKGSIPELSPKVIVDDIRIAKSKLVNKSATIVTNELGEIEIKPITPQQKQVIESQKDYLFGPSPHQSTSSKQDSTTSISNNIPHRLNLSKAELSLLESNQKNLTETGRADAFDNFDDEPELAELKRKLFKAHNEKLHLQWAIEQSTTPSLFEQQERSLQQLSGNNQLLRSFNNFQPVNKNEHLGQINSPTASSSQPHNETSSHKSPPQHENSQSLTYHDDEEIVAQAAENSKKQQTDAILNLSKMFMGGLDDTQPQNQGKQFNPIQPDVIDPTILPVQPAQPGQPGQPIDDTTPYFRKKFRAEALHEESKITDIFDNDTSFNSSLPTSSTSNHTNPTSFRFQLKDQPNNNEPDQIDREFDTIRLEAQTKDPIFSNKMHLQSAFKNYFTSPIADPNGTSHIQLRQGQEFEDTHFNQKQVIPEHLVDNALDPGPGQDPLQFDDHGRNILKSTDKYHETEQELQNIIRKRQEAIDKARLLHHLNQDDFSSVTEKLDVTDHQFFNAETGEVYSSRPAKPNRENNNKYLDVDHVSDASMMDATGKEFIEDLFDMGISKGGIGSGKQTKKDTSNESDELNERLQDLNEKMKTFVDQSKKTNISGGHEGIQMHPLDYINKFMLRIHPDMFAAPHYRVIDDRNEIQVGVKKTGQQSIHNRPIASSVEYETGEFMRPNDMRYYQVDGSFLQQHNTKALTAFNSLLEFYKGLAAMSEKEKMDPFLTHLQPNLVPKAQSLVFFVRPSNKSQLSKPKNLKLMKSLWDENGQEIRFNANGKRLRSKSNDSTNNTNSPHDNDTSPQQAENPNTPEDDDDLMDESIDDFIIQDDQSIESESLTMPHIKAIRVWFRSPPKLPQGTNPRDHTTVWMLQLERTFVEVLSGLSNDDVPNATLERWKTELATTFVSKSWDKLLTKKESYLDKLFKTDASDLVAPTASQLDELWSTGNMAYYHMFPYADSRREADFRAQTHPRHHLFNAMMIGGYVSFDSLIEPKQRIKILHDLNRIVSTDYHNLDCFRWWNRNLTSRDIFEQAQIEQYVKQGNNQLAKRGKLDPLEEELTNIFPYHDEERQNVWPNMQNGESMTLRFAIHYLPPGSEPTTQLVSSSKLIVDLHGTQGDRANVLKSILQVGMDNKAKRMREVNYMGQFDDQEVNQTDPQQQADQVFHLLQEKFNNHKQHISQLNQNGNIKPHTLKKQLQLKQFSELFHNDLDPDNPSSDVEASNLQRQYNHIQNSYLQQLMTGLYGIKNKQHLLTHFQAGNELSPTSHDINDSGNNITSNNEHEESVLENMILDVLTQRDTINALQSDIKTTHEQQRLKQQEVLYPPPTSMNDVCLQIRIPIGMSDLDFQAYVFSHAYVLYDEWKSTFTKYHVELHALQNKQQLLLDTYTKTGSPPKDPFFKVHLFSIGELLTFLGSSLAQKEKLITNPNNPKEKRIVPYSEIIMSGVHKHQPELGQLISFYQTMRTRTYRKIDIDPNPEKTIRKTQERVDSLKQLLYNNNSSMLDAIDLDKVDISHVKIQKLKSGGYMDTLQSQLAKDTLNQLLIKSPSSQTTSSKSSTITPHHSNAPPSPPTSSNVPPSFRPPPIMPSNQSQYAPHFITIRNCLISRAERSRREHQDNFRQFSSTYSQHINPSDTQSLQLEAELLRIQSMDAGEFEIFIEDQLNAYQQHLNQLNASPQIVALESEVVQSTKLRKGMGRLLVQKTKAKQHSLATGEFQKLPQKLQLQQQKELDQIQNDYLHLKALSQTYQDQIQFLQEQSSKDKFPILFQFLSGDDTNEVPTPEELDALQSEIQQEKEFLRRRELIIDDQTFFSLPPADRAQIARKILLQQDRDIQIEAGVPKHQQLGVTSAATFQDRMQSNQWMYRTKNHNQQGKPSSKLYKDFIDSNLGSADVNRFSVQLQDRIVESHHLQLQRKEQYLTALRQKQANQFDFNSQLQQNLALTKLNYHEKQLLALEQQRKHQTNHDHDQLHQKQHTEPQSTHKLLPQQDETDAQRIDRLVSEHNSGAAAKIEKEARQIQKSKQLDKLNLLQQKVNLVQVQHEFASALLSYKAKRLNVNVETTKSSHQPTSHTPQQTRRERRQSLHEDYALKQAQMTTSVNVKMKKSILQADEVKQTKVLTESSKVLQVAIDELDKRDSIMQNIKHSILHQPTRSSKAFFKHVPMDVQLTELRPSIDSAVNLSHMLPQGVTKDTFYDPNQPIRGTVTSPGYFGNIYGATADDTSAKHALKRYQDQLPHQRLQDEKRKNRLLEKASLEKRLGANLTPY